MWQNIPHKETNQIGNVDDNGDDDDDTVWREVELNCCFSLLPKKGRRVYNSWIMHEWDSASSEVYNEWENEK